MKKNICYLKLISLILIFATVCSLAVILVGCTNELSPNEVEYWFSSYKKSFVQYDEEANDGNGNIDEAGSVWEMTVKNDCNISILIYQSLDMFSTTYFYVNGKQVKAETDDFYTFAYMNLSLKKDDKIKIHSFWTNGIVASSNEMFTFNIFAIDDGSGTYPIEKIK